MKFKYGTRRRAIEYEKDIANAWKKNKTFEKSVQQRSADNSFVFYDGPPFITGAPHHGTLLSSIVKDCVPRYQTMKGKRVERRWGWDCHGLPAENFVEKQLNIVDRRDIGTKISLEDYITKARESMVANSELWESYIDRIGRWVDFKGAYKTMDKDFMESVWWAFKTMYDKGLIYEGERVLMYDTKFATPVSKAEVTMDNDAYQTVTDPSVYVKFKLIPGQKYHNDEWETHENTYLLAWTTTPWTLPGNTALAVNSDMSYWEVKLNDEILIIAKDLIDKVLVDDKHQPLDYEVVFDDVKGSDLVGLGYEPLMLDQKDWILKQVQDDTARANVHKVWPADYVSAESGTGIVHLAPIYGEEDFELAQQNNIPRLHILDDNGYYFPEVAEQLYKFMPWRDANEPLEVWDANKDIAKGLNKAGIVWKVEYIQHEYPFNPRSGQRIMYRAIPSWFFDIQGQKPLLLEQNENIYWFPEHIKHGRFAKNVQQAPDWNLSRDRFWATAMPVWKSDKGTIKVVGSYAELKELSGKELEDYHRPWVDSVKFTLADSKPTWNDSKILKQVQDDKIEHFKRIDKVLDCWFESGSMPFAQQHYPFENKAKFEANYPADFISEYTPQVRAWFYYLHVVNTALFGKNAFKNCIVTGTIAGEDGRKMSKSFGNYTDPNELMDKFSADSLRFLLLSSPLLSGEDFALKDKEVGDIARKLAMVWNMYDFFTMYAQVDGWEFDDKKSFTLNPTDVQSPLDKWIISRVHQLTKHLTNYMDVYNIPDAMSAIVPLIDDASNWYVRRSRRRFWKSEDDTDKAQAYRTLHYVLVKLAVLLAPFTPFLAEELYQLLTDGESVHLLDWPTNTTVDQPVLDSMTRAREIIEKGLALRMEREDSFGQIKVRQPLSQLIYGGDKLDDFYEQIIAEEVNVKTVKFSAKSPVSVNKTLTKELRQEGFVRELIRFVQNTRKNAGLNVDDRIKLSLSVKLNQEWQQLVAAETLATEVVADGNFAHDEIAQVDGQNITISLEKA
ncbi:isoleucine--tRNA ligase [Candidatus Saccharibacteria bacterium]|nr:isoleucine--tRNA ligase [Candidatus Saccharibacteria bacterium]